MNDKKSLRKHKFLTIMGVVMCLILIPILIVNLTLIAKSYINKDEVPNIGGVFPLIVLTDSMVPEIYSGDLIVCTTAEAEDIKEKDIISFIDPAGNGTSIVTHRVIEVINEDGEVFFRTQGDNNNTEDKQLVPAKNLVGIYKMTFAGAGNIAMFMQSTTGLIICVVLPVLLLVGYDFVRRRIYEKNKQSDTDALLAELEALRADKKKYRTTVEETGDEKENAPSK